MKEHSSAVFGKRKEPHTVIIAHGDQIRHFTVRPWLAALAGSVIAAFAIGYLLATSYLVLRDDLIGASVARQARLQQAYEDRISALRAQVDRITSRQLLDQQLMESKVAELLDRQSELSLRDGQLKPLLERATGRAGLPAEAPVPTDKPELRADLPALNAYAPTPAGNAAVSMLSRFTAAHAPANQEMSVADRADRLFVSINQSLREIETRQLQKIKLLTESAFQTADAIAETLKSAGLKIDAQYGEAGVGGPLLAVGEPGDFENEVEELDEALTKLDGIKAAVVRLPIANPAPGRPVSSGFGMRKDPLIGKQAFHAGIDFRIASGLPVRATGAGTVVMAGWNGGYGRMVEIDHGDGLATRYAHMSAIEVGAGEKVKAGDLLGKVGSSGRSTGSHLHYEVRRDGKAVNPVRFLKVGKAIGSYL